MVTRTRRMPARRLARTTRQVVWAKLTAEEVTPGDVLPWGTVLAKTWGGPLGIEAWRLVIADRHRPLWLARREIVYRRGRI